MSGSDGGWETSGPTASRRRRSDDDFTPRTPRGSRPGHPTYSTVRIAVIAAVVVVVGLLVWHFVAAHDSPAKCKRTNITSSSTGKPTLECQ